MLRLHIKMSIEPSLVCTISRNQSLMQPKMQKIACQIFKKPIMYKRWRVEDFPKLACHNVLNVTRRGEKQNSKWWRRKSTITTRGHPAWQVQLSKSEKKPEEEEGAIAEKVALTEKAVAKARAEGEKKAAKNSKPIEELDMAKFFLIQKSGQIYPICGLIWVRSLVRIRNAPAPVRIRSEIILIQNSIEILMIWYDLTRSEINLIQR